MGIFNSDTTMFVLSIVEIIGMILIAISALIYIILVACVRTLRPSINGFTVNFSLAAFVFSTFYLVYYGLSFRDDFVTVISPQGCNWLYYLSPVANTSVVYSLGVVSLNRLCMIVFHTKRLFKTKFWMIICITGAWVVAALLHLQNLLFDHTLCIRRSFPYWDNIYALLMIVLVPTLVFGATNLIIFNYVRKSTQRTQTEQHIRRRFVLSRRDIKLVKNMLLMFLLFTLGWTPIYIFRLTSFPVGIVRSRLDFGLTLLPVTSLLVNVIIVYYHHHELRNYILQRIVRQHDAPSNQRILTANNQQTSSLANI